MATSMHSTKMPDGRTLDVMVKDTGVNTKDIACMIDDKKVSFAEATHAWDEQPYEWQRGRGLMRAIRDWQGMP